MSIGTITSENGNQGQLGKAATQFPVDIVLGTKPYRFSIWTGQQLPDQLIAYDTETAAIQDKEIPQLAIATIYGDQGSYQGSCYYLHANDVPRFITMHRQAYWVCHNATFDFWVTAKLMQRDPSSLGAWWDIAGGSRMICTMLLDSLIRLARTDAEPINRNLAVVAAEYCGLQLDKSDPYRKRYGELIGLPTTTWSNTEIGFWRYAAADPVATLQIAQRQFQISQQLIKPHRSHFLPNAVTRFGPLTCCLQVQASIAMDYISRSGCSIDLPLAKSLQKTVFGLVEKNQAELEQRLPGCFKRYGDRSKKAGQLKYTKSGVPQKNANLIKDKLDQVAKEAEEPIRPRRLLDGRSTDSVKYWSQHQHLDPFVQAYCNFAKQAKLAEFFRGLKTDTIYPQYNPLKRTGRTSCSQPNLQQLPRDTRFREIIIPPPGFKLLQIDYSVLELRALAQICLRRYGRSRLAELFKAGIDPHKNTAALLRSLDLHRFQELPPREQKQDRQRAKAVNFGVPGGLGAASLVSYAKQGYGVEMTIEEAREFRKRLINTIYPELLLYLQDNQHQNIADNLQTRITLVRQALPNWRQMTNAMRIIAGNDSSITGEEYSAELMDHVWLTLQQLNQNPSLADDLTRKQPSLTLARRCFNGHALTISGRLRGHIGFTQAANTPFQGLAADGNKLALFRLLRAGFLVIGFIHDEMLVLVPVDADYTAAVQQVEQIMIESMQQFCPDIPITCEYLLADRWYKDAPEQPTDADGRIVAYSKGLSHE